MRLWVFQHRKKGVTEQKKYNSLSALHYALASCHLLFSESPCNVLAGWRRIFPSFFVPSHGMFPGNRVGHTKIMNFPKSVLRYMYMSFLLSFWGWMWHRIARFDFLSALFLGIFYVFVRASHPDICKDMKYFLLQHLARASLFLIKFKTVQRIYCIGCSEF